MKGAYWDTEIKRAQEQGLAGYPVFTRKAATDISYLACARALLAAAAAFFPHVRDAQRAHAGRRARARRRRRATSSSSDCTAWARSCMTRSSAGRPGRALPHLRAGRPPRGPARLPGAPPARERRQHLVRQSPRRRRGADRGDRRRPGRGRSRRREPKAAPAHPAARATCSPGAAIRGASC